MPKTQGISPKAILAALIPSLGGFVAVLVQWIATGEFDRHELATAIGTVIAAALAFAGAWAGQPGDVLRPATGQASDDLLMADPNVRRQMTGEAGYGLVEVLLAVFLVLVILFVLFRLA